MFLFKSKCGWCHSHDTWVDKVLEPAPKWIWNIVFRWTIWSREHGPTKFAIWWHNRYHNGYQVGM
jgi:hypothetical protein